MFDLTRRLERCIKIVTVLTKAVYVRFLFNLLSQQGRTEPPIRLAALLLLDYMLEDV